MARVTKWLVVNCDHVMGKYAATDEVCEARQDHDGTWYVSINPYGCSKNYRTPYDAVSGMLQEHGCTNIRVTDYQGKIETA